MNQTSVLQSLRQLAQAQLAVASKERTPTLDDAAFSGRARQILSGFDTNRYGMALEEMQRYLADPGLEQEFQTKFGISLEEYAQRLVRGESMGTALVGGKFGPPKSS